MQMQKDPPLKTKHKAGVNWIDFDLILCSLENLHEIMSHQYPFNRKMEIEGKEWLFVSSFTKIIELLTKYRKLHYQQTYMEDYFLKPMAVKKTKRKSE